METQEPRITSCRFWNALQMHWPNYRLRNLCSAFLTEDVHAQALLAM
jgi:hypothetical protein